MKTRITKWTFWLLLLILNFGVNAQNIITTTDPSFVGVCDGIATVDTSLIGVTTWNWQQDSVNVLQTDGLSFTNLCPGDYFLTYVNAQLETVYVDFTIINPNSTPCDSAFMANVTAMLAGIDASSSISCDGSMTALVTGIDGFGCTWSSNNGTILDPWSLTQNNLCPGQYTATIHTSCLLTLTVNIGIGTNPCDTSTLSAVLTPTNTNPDWCYGMMGIEVTGGVAPYNFISSNGASLGNQSSSDPLFEALCAGTYTITLFDAQNCVVVLTDTVEIDTNLTNPCTNSSFAVEMVATSVSEAGACDGSITAVAQGGTEPYTYWWLSGVTTPTLDNACSSVYTATVIDGIGCVIYASGYVGTIYDSTSITLDLDGYVLPVAVTASGECDGNASVIVYGGVAPYTFLFSDGSTNSSATNLCEGLQNVIVTDAEGSVLNIDFLIPVNIFTTDNFGDSTIVDSVYNTALTDCVINYSMVDSAYIMDYIILPNDSIFVTWGVIYGDSSVTITDYYALNLSSTPGVYMFALQIYCPNKSLGNFLTAYDQIYYDAAFAGIEKLSKTDLSVYPNPFNDQLIISLDNNQTSLVSITDIAGQEVYRNRYNCSFITIDVRSLSHGTYLLTVNNGTSVMTRKIIK